MKTPAEGELYLAGFQAYEPHRGDGYLQNPYLAGAGREAQALHWWQGFAAAREQARLANPRAA